MNSSYAFRSHAGPMTSAERQRLFRERHPNYNREYKARRRAAGERYVAKARRMTADGLRHHETPGDGAPPD